MFGSGSVLIRRAFTSTTMARTLSLSPPAPPLRNDSILPPKQDHDGEAVLSASPASTVDVAVVKVTDSSQKDKAEAAIAVQVQPTIAGKLQDAANSAAKAAKILIDEGQQSAHTAAVAVGLSEPTLADIVAKATKVAVSSSATTAHKVAVAVGLRRPSAGDELREAAVHMSAAAEIAIKDVKTKI